MKKIGDVFKKWNVCSNNFFLNGNNTLGKVSSNHNNID
jgi:hypothetical protein